MEKVGIRMDPKLCHKTILVVEDDADIQFNLRLFLEGEDYSVHSVYNGQQALDYLRQGSAPALILLDLMMPVMDGTAFLKCYRSPEFVSFSTAAVIVISAATSVEATAKEYGTQFVRKPFELSLLLEKINQACGRA